MSLHSIISAIKYADTPNLDAAGRLRISQQEVIYHIINEYDESPFSWEKKELNGGTVTHLGDESAVQLRTTTTSGSRVIRQTRQYFRYQPGRSQLAIMTGVFGAEKQGVRKIMGFGDGDNGLFFEQEYSASPGESMGVVVRSDTSGSPVDTRIDQKDWNKDKMDGTGPSGINLNFEKFQIFWIDFLWLGGGRIRFGFIAGGQVICVHDINNLNALEKVYMRTASLPLRYEIENTAATASQTDFIQICAYIASEGGKHHLDEAGLLFAGSNGATLRSIASGNRVPLYSIRLATAFNGKTNRGIVVPLGATVKTSQSCFWEVVLNGTLANDDWSAYKTGKSLVEQDTSATSITGGDTIAADYADKKATAKLIEEITSKIPLTLNIDGDASDVLSVCVTPFSNADCGAAASWKELY